MPRSARAEAARPLFPGRKQTNCYGASVWGFRPVASRFSRFAACSGAPSHRPSQGLGLRRFSERDYTRELRSAKWGFGLKLHSSNSEPLMSALGHKQTSRHLEPMSALPPKADIGTH